MVKHNNEIPHQHFHKHWQLRVKTWFNQPARAERRRKKRLAKAVRIFPRPINALRPAVHCPTIRYNRKVRLGRGFTPMELKAAGFKVSEAKTLGIAVDNRRRNISQESIVRNAARLKEYKSKLIVYPRKANQKKPKKGDSTPEEIAAAKITQIKGDIFPIKKAKPTNIAPRKITDKERKKKIVTHLIGERKRSQLKGLKIRRARKAAEAAATAAPKEK
eukprot:GEZU01042248.1.p2 GENE.GEZU01042248.1~~GEZU01042248.1.p2  ORF type:complete len:218 (-),score=102.89 GEZU01042248.1:274-927(-)